MPRACDGCVWKSGICRPVPAPVPEVDVGIDVLNRLADVLNAAAISRERVSPRPTWHDVRDRRSPSPTAARPVRFRDPDRAEVILIRDRPSVALPGAATLTEAGRVSDCTKTTSLVVSTGRRRARCS